MPARSGRAISISPSPESTNTPTLMFFSVPYVCSYERKKDIAIKNSTAGSRKYPTPNNAESAL